MAKRINIPDVTGNITITVRTSAINIENPTVLANMTYGKGINQTTGVITDNPECWATVDPVTVKQGKTYQISCDATWIWVYSFDDNDKFKSQLLLGNSVNPQTFTFNTDTTKIRYGCYDPNKQLSHCNLTEASTKINLNNINNMTVNKNESFYINYSTNISAVKHEFSWDGGETYWDKTNEIIAENTINYKYQHQSETAYDYFDMSIRVTDANGNISIKFFRIDFASSDSVLSNMTYGKGINQTTAIITDNAECWATINPITVTQGQSYEIACDATWVWVYSFDESDNFVSALVTGSDSNPQKYKFTANTSKIRYGCYDPNKQLTYCTLAESSISSYTIARNLINCSISNTSTTVNKGASYSAIISVNNGYVLSNITVTMGGNNISSTVVNGNNINIPNVTGDIVITAIATATSSGETGGGETGSENNHPKITQTSVIGDIKSSAVYSKYKSFFDDCSDNIIIPGLNSVMVPQGMCKSGNNIYVSAYDPSGKSYSCVYIINSSTKLLSKTVWLKDNHTHVGGLATDGSYLYVACSSRGTIGIISLSDLNNSTNNKDISLTYVPVVTDGGNSFTCSYCTYDTARNLLWVGIFDQNNSSYAYGFKTNGTSGLTLKCKIDVPAKTQGLFFDNNYVYYSISYGRNNNSYIYKCSITQSGTNYKYTKINTITAPPSSENIFIDNNCIYILFENAASYFYGSSDDPSKYPIDRICLYRLNASSGLKDFPYANELVNIAKTYWTNADDEYVSGKSWSQGTTYRSSNTPLSASCEANMDVTNSFWVAKGGRHYKAIDCSTLVGMALRGYTYENGPYANKSQFNAFRTNKNQTNPSVSWAFAVPRTAAEIGEYCYNKKWIVPLSSIGNSSNNFAGLKKGDLIFWAKKDSNGNYKEPDRFMKISHVAIVYGNSSTYSNRLSVIESTTVTSKVHTLSDGSTVNCGVRIKDIANNKPGEIVLVARIQI